MFDITIKNNASRTRTFITIDGDYRRGLLVTLIEMAGKGYAGSFPQVMESEGGNPAVKGHVKLICRTSMAWVDEFADVLKSAKWKLDEVGSGEVFDKLLKLRAVMPAIPAEELKIGDERQAQDTWF